MTAAGSSWLGAFGVLLALVAVVGGILLAFDAVIGFIEKRAERRERRR